MAPRVSTRSQRASKGFSRSQPQPSQSQRNAVARRRIESDEEEDEPQTQDDGYNGMIDVDDDEGPGDEISRKANQLVRLALFTEHRKVPLRRDDITKKVLGTSSRIFNRVFDSANGILKKTFGLELAELPSKASLDEEAGPNLEDEDLEEAKKAVGRKKKAVVTGSKTYILRSILHPGLIEYAALMHDKILEEEIADLPDDSDDDSHGIQTYGTILSYSTSDQLEVISDGDLRKQLKRLHLANNSEIRLTSLSVQRTIPLDRFLDSLIKQGYIDQRAIGEKKKGPGKRARATQGNDESGIQYEWRWGPRAHSEVGEKAIAQFVAEFMVSEEQQEDEDAEEGQGSSRGGTQRRRENAMSKLEKMMQGIEKVVGGNLLNLK